MQMAFGPGAIAVSEPFPGLLQPGVYPSGPLSAQIHPSLTMETIFHLHPEEQASIYPRSNAGPAPSVLPRAVMEQLYTVAEKVTPAARCSFTKADWNLTHHRFESRPQPIAHCRLEPCPRPITHRRLEPRPWPIALRRLEPLPLPIVHHRLESPVPTVDF